MTSSGGFSTPSGRSATASGRSATASGRSVTASGRSATASGRSVTASIDGGSRGNPGPAGYGVRIEQADGSIVELKEYLGHQTNNVAEYKGLLAALRWAAEHGVSRLLIRSDSELLVKQMRGEYRVKNPGLQPLYEEAQSLMRRIGDVTIEHVRRELNQDADRLANEAMDEGPASSQ